MFLSPIVAEGSSTADRKKKPGVCPRRHWDGTGCHELCSNDNECPKNEKCCSTGCGYKCMAPVLEKPGVCPRQPSDHKQCVKSCSNDGDCPDNQKCCSSGCGRMCMEPYTVMLLKAEKCPWNLNLALSRKGCRDCPRDHICCVSDGGEICVPPVSSKPGVCPHRIYVHANCVEDCYSDSDCPNNEKCCPNGCGHECMPAVIGER
ncbi:perlwapin-like [Archocentrus centrarchus]|uniref:perlwapin-like n=1 Tax=Archocentrus centrarchus TaxID=63155 RepID=UPI0011EA070B|nr:perlwapin-like [Archocentrus centrarchus]